MAGSLLLAIALMLILEGMLPFVFPSGWRNAFRKVTEMSTRRIRMGGLIAMLLGLLLLWVAT
jgi:uncharacterized protein YjeT (DUF2065 family)